MSIYPSCQQYTDQVIQISAQNESISQAIKSIQKSENQYRKQQIALQQQESLAHKISRLINKIVENFYFQIIISIITLFSLFMEDIRIIFFDKQFDEEIDAVHITFIVIFMIEILMSLTIPGYFCSFFFYLDIFSTLSIGMDVSILTNLIYASNQSGVQLSMIIRNSKASRAAARAVRVMKIFRLARIVKLYKSAIQTRQFQQKKNRQRIKQKINSIKLKKKQGAVKEQSESAFNQFKEEIEQISVNKEIKSLSQNNQKIPSNHLEQPEPSQVTQDLMNDQLTIKQGQSRISKVLSDSTIKKVIILILLLMFSVPIFATQNYFQQTNAWNFLIDFVASGLENPHIRIQKINNIISKNIRAIEKFEVYDDIVIFQSPFNQIYSLQKLDINTLRITDIQIYQKSLNMRKIMEAHPELTIKSQQIQSVSIMINYRQFNKIDSWFSIGKTLAICVAIVYLLSAFSQSITKLIIEPIEKILHQITSNKKQGIFQQKTHSEQSDQSSSRDKNSKATKQAKNNYETVVVLNSIQKITNLMSKVYNFQGKEAIYCKLTQKNGFKKTYLTQAKKNYCIFGLCTLQNNYELSILLGSQYFQLMSEIAQYFYSSVYRYGGYSVSNQSNGLLVAFKFPKNINTSQPITQKQAQIFADFALFSMVKTIVKINKQNKFNKYRKNPQVMKKFQNLQIKINCILHAGQAYEGFYGSPYKLDYCYVGQTLKELENIAYFSHKTSNNIFLSGSVYNKLTQNCKKLARIVSQISFDEQITNQSKTTPVYKIDLNINNITPPKSTFDRQKSSESSSISLKRQINMEYLKNPEQILDYDANVNLRSILEIHKFKKIAQIGSQKCIFLGISEKIQISLYKFQK